jgi:predicted HTH transcriptional regulator
MDTEVLESLLEGAEETDSLEFKGAMAWDKATLVKDILAMANVLDGGRIVIGVEDRTFVRQGLSPEDLATYDIDIMRDQIAPFADPLVVFSRVIVEDRNGINYVVIEVSPFEEIPVICKRDGADVQAGTIYYRSRAQRPQSARVATSSDMREIIESSVSRRMRQLRRMGFVAEPEVGYDYDAELGGL